MPQPVRRQPASRRRARALLLCLAACWLLVLAAPVAAQAPEAPVAAQAPEATATAPASGSAHDVTAPADREPAELAGTEPAGEADDAAEADRELVLGLVAIALLAATIGLHALYRDRD